MKLLILTGKFGMGHWSASQSLKQQMEAAQGAEVEVVDFFAATLPELSPTLYKGFNLLVTYGGGLYNLIHRLSENTAPLPVGDALVDKLADLLMEQRPGAVLSTHPLCSQLMARFKRDYGSDLPLVTCITDVTCHSEWIAPETNHYLVGSPSVRAGLIAKGVAAARITITGIPVREEFKQPVRRGGGLPRNLLIMGGGLGLLPRQEAFYEALNTLPNVHTTIITGNNRKLYRRLAGKWEHIEVLGFTDRVYDYMARSDLMLSKPGGITTFEAIFSQLPMLAWGPYLAQEQENAKFLTDTGVGMVTERDPETCLASIRALIYDDEALSRMSDNMGRLRAQLKSEYISDLVAGLARKRVSA